MIYKFTVEQIKQWRSYSEFQILSWTPTHLWYFDVYISDGVKIGKHLTLSWRRSLSYKICPANKWTGLYMKGTSVMKQLIACVRTGQRCNQSPSNIHDSTFDKKIISNINLKTLKVNLSCLTGSRTCLSGWMHYSS